MRPPSLFAAALHFPLHFEFPLDANLKLFDVVSAPLASASPSSYLFAVVHTFFDHNSLRRGPNAMQAFLVSEFFVHHAILFQEKASEHLHGDSLDLAEDSSSGLLGLLLRLLLNKFKTLLLSPVLHSADIH